MKSTLKHLIVPDSFKNKPTVAFSDGYMMNSSASAPDTSLFASGQPFRVPELRVMEVLSGEGALLVNLVRHDLSQGDFLVAPAGTVIERVFVGESFNFRVMSSRTDTIEKPCLVHPEEDDRKELESMMQMIWRGLHLEPQSVDFIRCLFQAFLAKIRYIGGKALQPKRLRSEEIFQLFIDAVNSYGSQNRRIPFMADKLGVSPHHLSAVVKEASGESAMDWIHRATIQRAKILLSQGMTALQVSEALEFPSAAYFSRYFKRLTGQTPGDYRKKL